MMEVIPVGYSVHASVIESCMSDEKTLLIDTRRNPVSSIPGWNGDELRRRYGKRYRFAGEYLGNNNYRGGPIEIADLATGLCGLQLYLEKGYRLLLMCGCGKYEACHRKVIVDALCGVSSSVRVICPDTIQKPGMIKCLSIQQPWSWLIAVGHKDIENREWATNYRGPVLLHAGAKLENDWFYRDRARLELMMRFGIETMPDKPTYATGAIIGMADLVDCVTYHSSPWFFGTYGFVMGNARLFDQPIRYRGQLKLFDVPLEVVPETRKSEAWAIK